MTKPRFNFLLTTYPLHGMEIVFIFQEFKRYKNNRNTYGMPFVLKGRIDAENIDPNSLIRTFSVKIDTPSIILVDLFKYYPPNVVGGYCTFNDCLRYNDNAFFTRNDCRRLWSYLKEEKNFEVYDYAFLEESIKISLDKDIDKVINKEIEKNGQT